MRLMVACGVAWGAGDARDACRRGIRIFDSGAIAIGFPRMFR